MSRISKAGLIVLILGVFVFTGMGGAWAEDKNAISDYNHLAEVSKEEEEQAPSYTKIGGDPASCGYTWDSERQGWHRPWDPESFIPDSDAPAGWDNYRPDVEELPVYIKIGRDPLPKEKMVERKVKPVTTQFGSVIRSQTKEEGKKGANRAVLPSKNVKPTLRTFTHYFGK